MQRKIPLHKSLYRPLLFVGCERLPFTIIVTIGGVITMAYANLYVLVTVFLFYVLSIIFIRRINENDCQFFKCMHRYITKYQDYYPAHAFYPGRSDKPESGFY